MTAPRKFKFTGFPAVTCPRGQHKTTGRLYRAAGTSVNVCHDCSLELKDLDYRVLRVR